MLAKIIFMLLLLQAVKIPAQSVLSNGGARNDGLGGQSAVSIDEWSLWRNPAGLAKETSAIAFGVRYTPLIKLPTRSAMLALATQRGCFAGGVSAFGDDLYNEHVLSFAFAHRLTNTNVGIRADLFQQSVDGSGVRRTIGVTIGGITAIGSRLMIGAVARNVNLPQWVKGHPLPVVLSAGLLFRPSGNFSVVAELEKNTDFDPTIKGAVEYSLRKKMFVRTGFNLFPEAAFGGFGFRLWRLGIDYALRWGYLPGYSQQMSVSVRPGKREKN
jgi:hypothetical protein